MKAIYNAIAEQLQPLMEQERLRWIDLDKGQLKKAGKGNRYPVAYPCALVRMGVISTTDITDKIQDCRASVTVTLAFDPQSYGRTAANAPAEVREQGLDPYDVINGVFALLQGCGTAEFDGFSRKSQSEVPHNDLFVYQLVFETQFQQQC